MFTVCPKCALTLVVTAADLRVAQGYVRCGRCSNVFNALARLSEDKGAPAAAQTQGTPPPSTSTEVGPKPQLNGAAAAQPQTPLAPTRPPPPTGSFVYTKPETPASTARPTQQGPSATQPPRAPPGANAAAPQASAPSSMAPRPAQQPATAAPLRPTPVAPIPAPSQTPPRAPLQASSPVPAPVSVPPQAPPPGSLPIELQLDDDDAIPEDALEFNADADVNQFFVQPPPSPEWTAATGTFKAIILKSEEPTPPPNSGPGSPKPLAATTPLVAKVDPRHAYPPPTEFNSKFEDDDIELDADFLSATSEMQRLQTGSIGEPTQSRDTPPPHETPTSREAPTPREVPSARDAGQSRETPQAPPPRELPISPAPQSHVAPSARMAPRGAPPPDTPAPTRTRAPAPEMQTRALSKPAPLELEPKDFPEAEVVSVARTPTRAPVKAFGLEPDEPQPRSLSSLARSVEATTTIGGIEPLPPERSLLGSATLWTVGTGAMILLLAIQVMNHYRNDLAATPQFNKPITALYSALGIQLTPRWDLRAYDVRQLGASVDAANAGEIMVRASVKNGAPQAQPMPLLRVTLQDRYGNRIAARDVPPGDYLPRATSGVGYLPAGQRIDAEMAFVDPGSNAVGFEIDACLPAAAGGIACANDPVSR